MRMHRLCLLALLVSVVWFDCQAVEPALIGQQSCATATCHGNTVGLGPAWNHSFSKFVLNDPHALAGQVLRNDLSKRIVERLDSSSRNNPARFDQVLRERCISCHTDATAADCEGDQLLAVELISKGVSCQSCHGPAGDWLTEHLSSTFKGPQRFESTSLRDTESLIGRAETCVRCHVGDRRSDGVVRDMNHDLIASGHPALRFDLPLYEANLPKHWNEKASTSQLMARDVGRSIALAAAARLAADRADDSTKGGGVPWPEFSDYDCFACHQDLKTFRPRTSLLRISLGMPIWNSWHTVEQVEMYDDPKRLSVLFPRQRNLSRVIAIGNQLSERFRQSASSEVESGADARAVFQAITSRVAAKVPFDWHHAAVDYLRLHAIVSDIDEWSSNTEIVALLDEMEQLLRFNPPDAETVGVTLVSPKHFQPGAFQRLVVEGLVPLVSSPPANTSEPAP